MADISNKMLGIIVGIALVISIIGLYTVSSNFGSITGFGTTGTAQINITQSAQLNVTQSLMDFGNGTVAQGFSGSVGGCPGCCVMSSLDGSRDPNSCFTATWGLKDATNSSFHAQNVGNVQLNVTVTSLYNSAAGFWGAGGGNYTFECLGNVTNNGAGGPITTWTTPTATAQNCSVYLNATYGQNEFLLAINISIPQAASGFKNDTWTFTATKA